MKKHLLTYLFLFSMVVLTFFVHAASPSLIETYYALSFNKWWIQFLSHCTGVFPFSLFELGVYSLLLYLAYLLCSWCYIAFKKKSTLKIHTIKMGCRLFYLAALLIILFYWEWGFNYNRIPLSSTLNLTRSTFTSKELGDLYSYLIEEANALRPFIPEDEKGHMVILEVMNVFLPQPI